jgi:predicted RNA-binding Zn-ribbon protein involved in translation (DUF1610 family)
MGYWDATDEALKKNGGHGPACPNCGKEMVPEDDHGSFRCFSCGNGLDTIPRLHIEGTIPQVDTTGMTDEEKALIPPVNRLNSMPTAAEQKMIQLSRLGPDAMDNPEYWKADKAVEEERRKALEKFEQRKKAEKK